MRKVIAGLALIFLGVTAITLIGLQFKPYGWIFYLAGLLCLLYVRGGFAKHTGLIYLSLGILGITEINTDISNSHMFSMAALLSLAVAIPYVVTRYIYKEKVITYPLTHGRRWYRYEIGYIALAGLVAYLVLPFYLHNTGAYHNWTVEPGAWNIFKFFIGTNALGIWDELFFVTTVLALLRRHVPFVWANLLQAVLFTSFLYELGFRGWAPFAIYPFALLQGYIFKRTESLLYIITIHLTLDFVLFMALINAYYPNWFPIFISR